MKRIKKEMKEKKTYFAPKMERVDVEIESPIAISAGGGGSWIDPQGGGGQPVWP